MSDVFYPERAQPFDQLVDTGVFQPLVKKAKDYARQAKADNTNRAYAADWKHFAAWCAASGISASTPDPQAVGLYLTSLATQPMAPGKPPVNVRTIERRLTGIAKGYERRGMTLDRKDLHIREVLQGIRNEHATPPARKMALLAPDIIAMINVLPTGLAGIRDRAILLVDFAGALRRSEIVGLDLGPKQTEDGRGWVEFLGEGMVLHIKGKSGWREVEIGRGSSERTCPVAALKQWITVAKITRGALFRKLAPKGLKVTERRIAQTGQHVARLVHWAVEAAGICPEMTVEQRRRAFGGHSLRAGLATGADVDERYVQRQLGHTTVTMTRRYQRDRDRFKVNLTKSAGL